MVCKDVEASQEHHLSYEPELIIEVCVDCHLKIHKHGVGRGKNKRKEHETPTIKPPKLEGTLTYMNKDLNPPLIMSKSTNEALYIKTCPNTREQEYCTSRSWFLLYEQSTDRFYIRCPHCGFDREILEVFDAEK